MIAAIAIHAAEQHAFPSIGQWQLLAVNSINEMPIAKKSPGSEDFPMVISAATAASRLGDGDDWFETLLGVETSTPARRFCCLLTIGTAAVRIFIQNSKPLIADLVTPCPT